MGGGHVSRPDFGMAQPDPAHPLTEFYLLVQQALDKAGCFALPALYASLQAPARRIYPEEAREYLRLAPQAGEGFVRLQAAVQMQVLYSSLQVAADGAPAALLLTEECTRSVTALQLLPPFVWEDPLPPLPDVPAALTLQLTVQDVEAIDADPAALGQRLVGSPAGKCWLPTPRPRPFWQSGWRCCSEYTGNDSHKTTQQRGSCRANGGFPFCFVWFHGILTHTHRILVEKTS